MSIDDFRRPQHSIRGGSGWRVLAVLAGLALTPEAASAAPPVRLPRPPVYERLPTLRPEPPSFRPRPRWNEAEPTRRPIEPFERIPVPVRPLIPSPETRNSALRSWAEFIPMEENPSDAMKRRFLESADRKLDTEIVDRPAGKPKVGGSEEDPAVVRLRKALDQNRVAYDRDPSGAPRLLVDGKSIAFAEASEHELSAAAKRLNVRAALQSVQAIDRLSSCCANRTVEQVLSSFARVSEHGLLFASETAVAKHVKTVMQSLAVGLPVELNLAKIGSLLDLSPPSLRGIERSGEVVRVHSVFNGTPFVTELSTRTNAVRVEVGPVADEAVWRRLTENIRATIPGSIGLRTRPGGNFDLSIGGRNSVSLTAAEVGRLETGQQLEASNPLHVHLTENETVLLVTPPDAQRSTSEAYAAYTKLSNALGKAYPSTIVFRDDPSPSVKVRAAALQDMNKSGPGQVAALVIGPDVKVNDFGMIANMLPTLRAKNVKLYSYSTQGLFEEAAPGAVVRVTYTNPGAREIVVMAGHVDSELAATIRKLGREGFFRNRAVVLTTCPTDGAGSAALTVQLQREIVSEFGAIGVFSFEGKSRQGANEKLFYDEISPALKGAFSVDPRSESYLGRVLNELKKERLWGTWQISQEPRLLPKLSRL